MKINVLGTKYTIKKRNRVDDEILCTSDGYCDKTSKLIVVLTEDENCELDDFQRYQNKALRHEIIHAFLIESGLSCNWEHPNKFGHDETTVDWFAFQFPKLQKAFEEAGCLD